jgi:hypothetical protein
MSNPILKYLAVDGTAGQQIDLGVACGYVYIINKGPDPAYVALTGQPTVGLGNGQKQLIQNESWIAQEIIKYLTVDNQNGRTINMGALCSGLYLINKGADSVYVSFTGQPSNSLATGQKQLILQENLILNGVSLQTLYVKSAGSSGLEVSGTVNGVSVKTLNLISAGNSDVEVMGIQNS